MTPDEGEKIFNRLQDILCKGRVKFVVHEHEATRTIEEAERNLSFAVERIVKTVAFRTRVGGIVLAALRGSRRVDYARLAVLIGVNRRDIAPLSPLEVKQFTGVEPGSVSPLMPVEDALLIIDYDVFSIFPTLYCGSGRPDRTLELAPDDLAQLTGARFASLSKATQGRN
jgi:Cys-tRNA(Pro)/Cys-tRNA(Cys) deacylase